MLVLAHPLVALVGLAGLAPLAVAAVRLRRARQLRRELGLAAPRLPAAAARPLALVVLFALLGLAAAQPSLKLRHERSVRSDVQVFVALDASRSMLASSTRGGPERWQRARAFAARLPAALPGVAIGLGSLTNRLLPYLFPTSDGRTYELVLADAYGIERPPPALTVDPWVTVFDPLLEVTRREFFSPSVRRHVLVVLTDAEAHPFDAASLRRSLERAGTTPVVVRFWHAGERIFAPGSASYRATQPGALAALREAGWPAYPETELPAALARIRSAVGSGPLVRVGVTTDVVDLGVWLAAAALVPLVFLLVHGAHLRAPARAARRRFGTVPAR